eukprot:Skav209091  [mRNA]  locus=scaffold207:872075:872755:- [translate_table: standard]
MDESTDTLEGVTKDLSEGGLVVDVELVAATIAGIDACLRALGGLCHPDARKQDEVEIVPPVNRDLNNEQYQLVLLDDDHAAQDLQILEEPLNRENAHIQMDAAMRDLDRMDLGLRPAPKPSAQKKKGRAAAESPKAPKRKATKKKAVKPPKGSKKRSKKTKKLNEAQLKRKLHSASRLQTISSKICCNQMIRFDISQLSDMMSVHSSLLRCTPQLGSMRRPMESLM